MDFSAFDTVEMERCAAEAKAKWGKTEAYKEFEQKTAGQTEAQRNAAGDGLMVIFAQLGAVRQLSPSAREAQILVAELQNYITEHFYACTKQILRGLGQLYIAGGDMTENIDRAGGEGTAAFTHQAIESYCK